MKTKDHFQLFLETIFLSHYILPYSLVVYNIGIERINPLRTTLKTTLIYNSDAEERNPVITTLVRSKQLRGNCLTSMMSESENR